MNDSIPTAGTIIIYDKTTEATPIIFSVYHSTTAFTAYTVVLDVAFTTGLYVGFTTTNDINVLVSYR